MRDSGLLGGVEVNIERKPTVLVVTGPTAGGKSQLGLEFAERFSGEIINADSVQFFAGFDIGSAKPSEEQQRRVPHHLFSVLSLDRQGRRATFQGNQLSAAWFAEQARGVIGEVLNRGNLPIVVGGSGLYLRALLDGLVEIPTSVSDAAKLVAERESHFRCQLNSSEAAGDTDCAQLGTAELENAVRDQMHRWLGELDPIAAERIPATDLVRVRRALAVILGAGRSVKELGVEQGKTRSLEESLGVRSLVVVVAPKRQLLYDRIDRRVEQMLQAGLLSEVAELRSRFLDCVKSTYANPFRSIGYRHALEVLDGRWGFEYMVEKMKQDTRNYAKRQLTWWRNQPDKLGWQKLDCVIAGRTALFNHPIIQQFLSGDSVVVGIDSVRQSGVGEREQSGLEVSVRADHGPRSLGSRGVWWIALEN